MRFATRSSGCYPRAGDSKASGARLRLRRRPGARHSVGEADAAELSGCDIDATSIEWLDRNLSPPLKVFRCEERPPLPRAAGYFDLIWAASVFTHLTDTWSAWLVELHRVLADGGFLLASFFDRDVVDSLSVHPWGEHDVGMNVIHHWQDDWEAGGPVVLHSDWWLRARWGRAFDVVRIDRDSPFSPFAASTARRWGVFRKREVEISTEQLERPEPEEPRELSALRHNLRQAQRELDAQRALVSELEGSRSWRLTRPLRVAGALGRRLR